MHLVGWFIWMIFFNWLQKYCLQIKVASSFWLLTLQQRQCCTYKQPDQILYCRHVGGGRIDAIWLICSGTVEKSLNNDCISAARLDIRWPLVQGDIMHNDETWLMYVDTPTFVNKKVQLDATVCRHLFTAKSIYMFRPSQHPSSGALKTVTATSGIGHNTGTVVLCCGVTPETCRLTLQ